VFEFLSTRSRQEQLAMQDESKKHCIMVGCDLHDKSMLLKVAAGKDKPETKTFENTAAQRVQMIKWLKGKSKAKHCKQIYFAYEASGQGFGLYDELKAAEIECWVLAPTRMERSVKEKSRKTDEKDALKILELVRGHLLAGNDLPAVWVADPELREDRMLMRRRETVAQQLTRTKTRVTFLLKLAKIERPEIVGDAWSAADRRWLREVGESEHYGWAMRMALQSLLRELAFLEDEEKELGKQINALAETEPYGEAVAKLCELAGIGVLTAMVLVTEMGDASRFKNRRELAAYWGLVPSSNESGEANDRKGHITRQGSGHVRRMLCQAVWAAVRTDGVIGAKYRRIVERNPRKKKIALVAMMRQMAIKAWHIVCLVQAQAACTSSADG